MGEATIIDGVDYGPLAALIGVWKGDKGVDVAPEPEGQERNLYYETILYEACGDVDNAETQFLSIVRYHQVVSRKTNDEVFHNETGYWLWDAKAGVIMHTLTIPRAVCLIAGGNAEAPESLDQELVLEVRAAADDPDWKIIEGPFMRDNARTLEFSQSITVDGDSMVYVENSVLDIYGRRFEHTDRNRLTRVQSAEA